MLRLYVPTTCLPGYPPGIHPPVYIIFPAAPGNNGYEHRIVVVLRVNIVQLEAEREVNDLCFSAETRHVFWWYIRGCLTETEALRLIGQACLNRRDRQEQAPYGQRMRPDGMEDAV